MCCIKLPAQGWVGVPRINRELHACRNNSWLVWLRNYPTNSRNCGSSPSVGSINCPRRNLSKTSHRILPHIHWKCAGMILCAFELDKIVSQASDGADDSNRHLSLFQHRSLLNMQLDKNIDIIPLCFENSPRVQSSILHSAGHGLAVKTEQIFGLIRRYRPCNRPRAPKIRAWKST